MRMMLRSVVLGLGLFLAFATAQAGVFSGTVIVNGEVKTFNYNSVQDAINTFTTDGLTSLLGTDFNSNTESVSAAINLRGMPAVVNYYYPGDPNNPNTGHQAGQAELTIKIPKAGIDLDFTGATLDDVQTQLTDWFKGQGQSTVTQLFQAMVKYTPYDPVAGNPSSMMARMVDDEFDIAKQTPLSQVSATGNWFNLFSLQPSTSQYALDGQTISTYNLPIRDTMYFNGGKSALVLDLPITYQQTSGSTTYSAEAGLAFAQAITKYWSIVPEFHFGAVGSLDLGSATFVYDGAIANRVKVPVKQFEIGFTDSFSWMRTQTVNVGDYHISYDLSNFGWKNGVDLTYNFKAIPLALSTYYNYTWVSGDTWYIPTYTEVGLSVINTKIYNGLRYARVRLSGEYDFAPEGFNGYSAVLAFNF